jgi:hypothetical protein
MVSCTCRCFKRRSAQCRRFCFLGYGSKLRLPVIISFSEQVLFQYRVTPFTSQDLTDTGFSLVTDPFDKVASPNGWHRYGTTNTTDTSGNNVRSYIAGNAGYETTAQSSSTNVYDYVRNPNLSVSEGPNPDAARVNVFYIANMMHDLTVSESLIQPFSPTNL